MGIGKASGENRAVEAAKQAISSPLLETTINGATGVLLNITGGSNLTLFEVTDAAEQVRQSADPDANIIFGTALDESLGDEIKITVIATGFDKLPEIKPQRPRNEEVEQEKGPRVVNVDDDSDLDIPPFIRNQRARR